MQGGNEALQTVPFTENFGGIAEIDYSLVSGPTFGGNYLTLNSKAEFYYLPHKTVCKRLSMPNVTDILFPSAGGSLLRQPDAG